MKLTFCQEPLHSVNWLRERPIAHRCLHNPDAGSYENTLSAARAAIQKNYAIEVDLQPSADCVPMVFHDYQTKRMTGRDANTRELTAAELSKLRIRETKDTIPTLQQLLEVVDSKVGLVLELKGHLPSDNGFVAAVAKQLDGYEGHVAIMSFAHHLLQDGRKLAPHLPLGLTAEGDDRHYETHRDISIETNVDFVSYHVEGLETRFAKEFRQTGRPMISWTIRTEEAVEYCYQHCDQPTFECIEV